MKTLIAILALSLSAFAQSGCTAHGNLHLVAPSTTVYCKQGGVTLWAVTYNVSNNLLVITSTVTGNYWELPLYVDMEYRNTTTSLRRDVFTLKTSFKEDDYG